MRELITKTNLKQQTGTGSNRPSRKRRYGRGSLIFLVGCLAVICGPPLKGAEPATITFSLDFPGSDPERYSISAPFDGLARYECSAKISADSDERENYQAEFSLSAATRTRLFDLAAQAHYFSGKIDSGNHKLANTGAKTLVYKDAQREFTAAYNFSPIPAIQQLTALFQSIVATLEFRRRLAYSHRYQKLALDDELKRMEDQARRGELIELQAVRPVLQEIYDDSSVMNIVRARAQRIMDMGPGGAAGR